MEKENVIYQIHTHRKNIINPKTPNLAIDIVHVMFNSYIYNI